MQLAVLRVYIWLQLNLKHDLGNENTPVEGNARI
jgi:hypothetical protein